MSFTYNLNGHLIAFKAEPEDMANTSLIWMYKNFPFFETNIARFRTIEGLIVTKTSLDISFDSFYNTYGYKVGNKKRAMKLWDAMNETDRIACLSSIPKYKLHIGRTTQAQAYPETYLSQRRWENEYR